MMPRREPPEVLSIPELEGEYEIVRELGRGGTAVVYLARERELGRDVAIKLIRPAYVKDDDAIARLVREARTVGKLQHPNIVMLLGTRRLGDQGLALILQYVPGRTLKERIREEGPLAFDEAERILRDLGRALAYAHRHRIVHRDIKPENVYLDDACDMARLADFGIARAWDSDSGLTLPGTAIGTPSYMSPEQVDGKDLDGRSDLYSLGLVGYEMLTAQQPWAGESLYSVIYKQKHEELPSLRGFRPDVPDNLRKAIEGALPKKPDDRWGHADAFLAALAEGSTLGPEGSGALGADDDLSAFESPWTVGFEPVDARDRSAEGASGEPAKDAAGSRSASAAVADRRSDRWPGAKAHSPGPYAPGRRRVKARADGSGLLRTGAAVAILAALVLGGVFMLGPEGTARSLFDSLNPLATAPPETGWEESGALEPITATQDLPPVEPEAPVAVAEDTGGLGVPAEASVIRGMGQAGRPGTALAEPLVLQVVDSEGRAVGEVPVQFEVLSGGGFAEPSEGLTAPDGTVLTRWTLGEGEGEQTLQARVPGIDGLEVLFRAGVRAPAVGRTEVVAGDRQEAEVGGLLPEPIEVRVLDGAGSPLAGVPVRFETVSGGGSVAPPVVSTDRRGLARATWTLGPSAGAQEVRVAVDGSRDADARVTAVARSTRLSVRAGVAVGGTHTCSLRSNGTTVCWGANDDGQLGDDTRSRRMVPGASVEGGPFVDIASGLSHVCALNETGEAFCWGSNASGQLGADWGTRRASPGAVSGGMRFTRITAGATHTCAVTAGGAANCWGGNESGQLGNGSTQPLSAPGPVRSNVSFRDVAAGWRHTCALSGQGLAFCWGANASGQLGSGSGVGSRLPRAVQGEHRFRALDAGNAHTCGVTAAGQVLCWGDNEHGQLGDDTTESRSTPTPIVGDLAFRTVEVGALHTCGLSEDGRAFCWGRNLYGQLGDGTTADRTAPTPVSGGHRFAQLQAFGSHTCGRTPSGEVLCWGYNVEGQLGDGSRSNRLVPTPVSSARP